MTDTKQAVKAMREAMVDYDSRQGHAPMIAKEGFATTCHRLLPPILDRLEGLEHLAEARGDAMRTYEARVREWTALAGSEKRRADTLQSQLENPWRPISEAPRDGTVILVCNVADIESAMPAQWLSGEMWQNYAYGILLHPTHWMPLPPIPP